MVNKPWQATALGRAFNFSVEGNHCWIKREMDLFGQSREEMDAE